MRWLQRSVAPPDRLARTAPEDAARLADAEREADETPAGCEWLDQQTASDLELALTFRAIDRTASMLGGQALWRWLVAPVRDAAILTERERKLQLLGDAELRRRIARCAPETARIDADQLPQLLWGPIPVIARPRLAYVIAAILIASVASIAIWSSSFVVPLLLAMAAASIYDMVAQRELALHAHALGILATTLDGAARLAHDPALPAELRDDIHDDLAVRGRLLRSLFLLRTDDPIGVLELLRSAFLIRVFTVHRAMAIVAAERSRLRRIVRWVGELDALQAIARLRVERDDARVPEHAGGGPIVAREIVHPAVDNAIGNDLELAGGLLVTGSNASGKSTFLRAVAINAILAQAIHTTFGTWHAPLLRVRTAMRIQDDLGRGMSTYMAEVETIGQLVRAPEVAMPTLFVLDEPFHGTNPVVRVPIVVAVLEYLAADQFVIAATHDLDVARQVSEQFERAYFAELDSGKFDRRMRPGIAPSSNAIAILERAGYPRDLLDRIAQVAAR